MTTMTKKLEELKAKSPLLSVRLSRINKIHNETLIQVCNAASQKNMDFFYWSSNSSSVLCGMRQALFEYAGLSDKTLIKIAAKTAGGGVVKMSEMRLLARHLEDRIDAGDAYVVVQANCDRKKDEKKRQNVVFELHAFRRFFARKCSNCNKTRDDGKLFDRCGSCSLVHYCSRSCQLENWKMGHKNVCLGDERLANVVIRCCFRLLARIHPAHKFTFDKRIQVNMKSTTSSERERLERMSAKLGDG